jgi:hypothetical protein
MFRPPIEGKGPNPGDSTPPSYSYLETLNCYRWTLGLLLYLFSAICRSNDSCRELHNTGTSV